MTKEESLAVTGYIARIIAENAPRISYTANQVEEARAKYSKEELHRLAVEGFYQGDFETFYIMLRFCGGINLWDRADEEYLRALFAQAKKMDPNQFRRDPYLEKIRIKKRRLGEILLTESQYEAGEFFQYAMPDLQGDLVVPKIGFFPERVSFPAIYEGTMPWVSVCPSEISSMTPDLEPARGKVLVLGLGLGYYPFCVSEKKSVQTVTVVEKNPEIIRLFQEEILPQCPHKEKIRICQADAFSFLERVQPGDYDFCYADIWEGWEDGARAYKKIFPHEKRLVGTQFCYWIKEEILWYLEETEGLGNGTSS